MKILLTGATGFIGRSVERRLNDSGFQVLTTGRSQLDKLNRVDFAVGNIDGKTDWLNALDGVDVVVHLAASAHNMRRVSNDALKDFRSVNHEGTINLAKQATKSGVKRFVFLSSIGVNGSISSAPFTEMDIPNPTEPYAISKFDAETGLLELAKATDLEIVIVRSPMVYGRNPPGNLARLMAAIERGVPLPFGLVRNKRTLISTENLVSLIECCITKKNASNQIFLAGDDEDISTAELIIRLSKVVGRKPILVPVPTALLNFIGLLLGRRALIEKICGNLQIDNSKAKTLLGWLPEKSTFNTFEKMMEAQK